MKFIIGLLTGTLGVLALTSVAGFDWQPPSRKPAQALEVDEPRTKAVVVAPESVVPIRSVTIAPLPAEPLPAEPLPGPSPLPALLSQPDRLAVVAAPVGNKLAQVASVPPRPLNAEPGLEPDEIAKSQPAETVSATAPETAVVWKPFHSEVSATGFARRLSTQLGYPFRALREGPAKYHVVFDYGSDEQRELLREQVRALTGFSVI